MDETELDTLLQKLPGLEPIGKPILKYETGRSGATVLVGMFEQEGMTGPGSVQPYVVKITESLWIENELNFFESDAAKSLKHLIAWLDPHTPISSIPSQDQTKATLVYTVAHDTLQNTVVSLATAFDDINALGDEQAIQQIKILTEKLVDWYIERGYIVNTPPLAPHELLQEMLDWRAKGINERLQEKLPDWNQTDGRVTFQGQTIYNPLPHLLGDAWSWTTCRPPFPAGRIHGDLCTRNILCLTQAEGNTPPRIIDFEHTVPQGVLLFDFAYLEYDILQNILRMPMNASTKDPYFKQWNDLLEHTMSTIVLPTSLPPGPLPQSVRRAWKFITPIREQVNRLLHDTQEKDPEKRSTVREMYEWTWWFATIAVGLNYACKKDQASHERKAALYYASFGLKKLYDLLPPRTATSSATSEVPVLTEEEQLQRYHQTLRKTIPDKVDLSAFLDTAISMPPVKLTDVFVWPRVTSGPLFDGTPTLPNYQTFYGNPKPPKESWQEQQHTSLQVEGLSEVLGKNKHTVILGNVGTGKTTLLHYLLLKVINKNDANFACAFPHLVNLLPIYIDFTEYASAVFDASLPFKNFLEKHIEKHYPACKPLLLDKIERGEVLFLFDSLDTIHEKGNRSQAAQLMQMFSLTPPSDNHYIVTSRITSYAQGTELNRYSTYILLPFNDPQIKLLIKRWYDSYQQLSKGRVEDEPILQRLCRDRSIYELATHPLFLTILITKHLHENGLPFQRIRYFQQCIDMLFSQHWLIARDLTLSSAAIEALHQRLCTLSLWIHEHPSTRHCNFDDVFGRVSLNNDQANQWEKDVEVVIKRLIERHNQAYAFLCYPLQEYLAAEALGDQGKLDDSIEEHLHTPHWREVLRLTISRFIYQKRNQEDKSASSEKIRDLIGKIYHSKDAEDPLQPYNLLLAGQCLVDNAVNGYDELEEKIIGAIVQEYLGCSDWLRATFSHVLRDWNNTPGAKRARKTLGEVLNNPASSVSGETWDKGVAYNYQVLVMNSKLKEEKTRQLHIMTLLYYLNEKTHVATWINTAIGMLTSATDDEVRAVAAITLGVLGQEDPSKVKAVLLGQAFSDHIWQVRAAAAKALGSLANVDASISNDLHAILSQGTTSIRIQRTQETSAMALGQVSHIADNALQFIISYLSNTPNPGNMPTPNNTGVSKLSENPAIRRSFVLATGLMARKQPEDISQQRIQVLSLLLKAINDEDASVRQAAAIALGCLGKQYWVGDAQADIINALLTAHADIYFPVVETANKALEYLGNYPLLVGKLPS